MSFSLLTPPAQEPITLAEAKAHARIDGSDEDALIAALISSARQWAETYTNRAFITQTWQKSIDQSPDNGGADWDGVRQGPIMGQGAISFIPLPRAPLQSVVSVQVFDNADTPVVWNASNYYVDTLRQPGRLALRLGATWPVATRPANGIVITYTCGYGDTAASVPEAIKTALRQLVTHWIEHRGDAMAAPTTRGTTVANAIPVPMVIQAVLAPFRIRSTGV